jgi:hypothetical protein
LKDVLDERLIGFIDAWKKMLQNYFFEICGFSQRPLREKHFSQREQSNC